MKKLTPIIAAIILLAACSHKDGELDTRKQLKYVYSASSADEDGVEIYNNALHQVQAWKWDGDELYRIDYTEDNATYSENLFFDGKERLIRTTVPAYKLRSELTYAGRELDHITVYKEDALMYTLHFTHEDGEVRTIEQEFADGSPEVTHTLRWNKGNVTYMKSVCDDQVVETRYTYDSYRNPMRDLYSLFTLGEGFDPVMMSKNNVVTKICPFDRSDSYTFTYTYEYDGKYPVSRSVVYTKTSMNTSTFEPSTITVRERREYQY